MPPRPITCARSLTRHWPPAAPRSDFTTRPRCSDELPLTHATERPTRVHSITSMAPAAKRQRTKAITYPCHTCLEDRNTGSFPDVNPTSTCDHLINTCKRCLKQWIESQIETTVFTPHIQCPQCDEKMNSMDVEMAIPKKMFARYASRDSMTFHFPKY